MTPTVVVSSLLPASVAVAVELVNGTPVRIVLAEGLRQATATALVAQALGNGMRRDARSA